MVVEVEGDGGVNCSGGGMVVLIVVVTMEVGLKVVILTTYKLSQN